MKVKYDVGSFGSTRKGLKIFRDALAKWHDKPVAVVAVPSNTMCLGFFLFNQDGEAVWTGDGFRMDLMGEGGAGMKSALGLLYLYGLEHLVWNEVSFWKADKKELANLISKTAEDIFKTLKPSDFKVPRDQSPYYIR